MILTLKSTGSPFQEGKKNKVLLFILILVT